MAAVRNISIHIIRLVSYVCLPLKASCCEHAATHFCFVELSSGMEKECLFQICRNFWRPEIHHRYEG